MAQQPRFNRQRQALLALVQMRQQHLEPGGELTTDLHRYAHAAHTTPASPKTESDTLFRSGFCGPSNVGYGWQGTRRAAPPTAQERHRRPPAPAPACRADADHAATPPTTQSTRAARR